MQKPNQATATMRSRRPRRGPTRPLPTPTERKTLNAVPRELACHVARAKFVATWSSRAPAGTADGTMSRFVLCFYLQLFAAIFTTIGVSCYFFEGYGNGLQRRPELAVPPFHPSIGSRFS
jgi:hypothetical protein